ncbi:MAG: elongation factor G [Dehalococcoidia bacterium]|nr:elongation factor G [Dehalococcoidia bacterium]MCB9486080.1 elongation factor G [Thermoflexaceae bacterium]
MQVYDTQHIRNVILMGHGSVGKTSLSEAALFVSGATTRLGSVEDGNTTSDFDEDEHKRKFSINMTVIPVEWEDHKINFIDTPGYADFVSEVVSAAAAADAALVIVDAVSGPEVGTDRVWQIADRRAMPRMIVINRMDRENANFEAVLEACQRRWGHRVAPLQLPIGSHYSFSGVVDLLAMKAFLGPDATEADVPAESMEEAETLRASLIETIVENDDELMDKYFSDQALTREELNSVLHKAVARGQVVPVLVTSARELSGVRRLLHRLVEVAPSPAEVQAPQAEDGTLIQVDANAPLVVQVFKTAADPFVGKLSYLRVHSGTLVPESVHNVSKGLEERVGSVAVAKGNHQEQVPELHAGDIGVVTKLAHTTTGDTLALKGNEVRLPDIVFPNPVFSMAVHPTSKAGVDKLGPSLQRLLEEDPGLRLARDPGTNETLLSGLGDAHLEVTVERLRQKFHVDVELTTPRVPYRETVGKKGTADYTHKKQTGGHGQYARVAIEVNPLGRGDGLRFSEKIYGGSVPREFVPAVDKGIHETAKEGVVAGYELTDCEVVLTDGKHHPVDSSEMSFKLAASQALKEAVADASPTLLEPVMRIRIMAPEDHAGDVVSDLNTKRARIHGITPDGAMSIVDAEVPLAEVQHYAADLRSLTQGRGGFELDFDHYGEVPSHIAQKVISDVKAAQETHGH